MTPSLPVLWRVKRLYVRFMLAFIGHGLAKACRTDKLIQKEIASLPDGFTFSMSVMPRGPCLYMKKRDGRIKPGRKNSETKPDVDIQFKHLAMLLIRSLFRKAQPRPLPGSEWWWMATFPLP